MCSAACGHYDPTLVGILSFERVPFHCPSRFEHIGWISSIFPRSFPGERTITSFSLSHNPSLLMREKMSIPRLLTTLTILVASANAIPAPHEFLLSPTYSTKSFTNGAIQNEYIDDVRVSTVNITVTEDIQDGASYRLFETYDASNWMSKFNVKGVCQ